MASSMIHLAITNSIIDEMKIDDPFRLRLGCILPDAAVHGNGHLKIRICDATRSTLWNYRVNQFWRLRNLT